MLKENTKISYLKKVKENKPLFQSEAIDWPEKLGRLLLKNTFPKVEFLNNESITDYILKELKSEKFIEEKIDDDIDPNNHFKLTQKWEHFLKSYQDSLKYRIELWLSDYPLLFTNLIAIIALVISIIALFK